MIRDERDRTSLGASS